MYKNISGLVVGTLFGLGLAASGMTNTAKVIGFLDLFGHWDVDLLFVMGSAVAVTFIGFKLVLKRDTPLFDSSFSLPTNTKLDPKLIIGAAIFGIGWGLYGYCPGPAIASLVYLSPTTVAFVVSMVLGFWIGASISNKYSKNTL